MLRNAVYIRVPLYCVWCTLLQAITLRCRRCNKPVKASKTCNGKTHMCTYMYAKIIYYAYIIIISTYLLVYTCTDDLLPNAHGKCKRNKYLKRIPTPLSIRLYLCCIGIAEYLYKKQYLLSKIISTFSRETL